MKKKIIYTLFYSILIVAVSLVLFFAFSKKDKTIVSNSNDIEKYNLKNSVLVYYEDFDKAKDYLNSSKEYELLYIGRSDCSYCKGYVPAINEVMYEKNKPILYFSNKDIRNTEVKNGVVVNNEKYQAVVDWIVDNSEDAILKEYVKYDTVEGAENNKLLRLYTPRFFLVKNGKIVDCFKASNCNNLKGETEQEQLTIKENFKMWLDERI